VGIMAGIGEEGYRKGHDQNEKTDSEHGRYTPFLPLVVVTETLRHANVSLTWSQVIPLAKGRADHHSIGQEAVKPDQLHRSSPLALQSFVVLAADRAFHRRSFQVDSHRHR
jgi:hypothetical protein